MRNSHADFDDRLSTLDRKHAAMNYGFSTVLRSDGLIVVQPKRKLTRGFPLKGLLTLGLGFFLFKALLLASLSEVTYNERLEKLNHGSVVEKGGAWVMQIDPVTRLIAGYVEPLID